MPFLCSKLETKLQAGKKSRTIRALLVGKGLINVKIKSASGWCVVETQQGRFTEVG